MSADSINNEQPKQAQAAHFHDVSPDSLMSDFRGKPITTIVLFTIVVHVGFIGVFSVRYLVRQVIGEDTSSLSEAERLDIAAREGREALIEIAERHEVSVDALTSRFDKAAGKSTSAPDPGPTPETPGPTTPDGTGEAKTDYEKQLEETLPPPADPNLSTDIDEEEPIFPEP